MKKIVFNENNAKLYGRTIIKNDLLNLIMSGTGCEFTFTGKKLQLKIGCDKNSLNAGNSCNLPRIAILVNNIFIIKKVIDKRSELFNVFESNETESVNIKIIKLSEAAFSIAEVYPTEINDDETIVPVPLKKRRIEFIGDSITCGYGVDDSNLESAFSTCAENSMKSYAYLTAQTLDADYSLFSASGYGIISGYTADGTKVADELIPTFYDSLGFSIGCTSDNIMPQNIQWDFSRFTPDVVVINLGTNDSSYCKASVEAQQEFEEEYLVFLKRVCSHYPNAEIFCTLGMMDTLLTKYIVNAAERCSKDIGSNKIHIFEFDMQNGLLGYSSNWHPSEDTHKAAAKKLSEYIASVLGWKI